MNRFVFLFTFIIFTLAGSAQSTLVHYWHFNNFVSGYSSATNPANLQPYRADFSLLDTHAVKVIYRTLPGTSSAYTTFWDGSTTGDTTNLRMSQTAGKYLRLRNPSDSMQLQFYIPTTGFKNIVAKYTTQRSSAGNGATIQRFSYSLDSGLTWLTSGLSIDSFLTSATWTSTPVSIQINNPLAQNNPHLVFRIIFSGTQNTGTSGNTRIDNFTIDGTPYVPAVSELLHYWHFNTFTGVSAATNPNTLAPFPADSSLLNTSIVKVAFRTKAGTSSLYTTYWDNVTGSSSNAQYSTVAGLGLRLRNPTDSMFLHFYIPSTGHYAPKIQFATQKSSTSNGAAVMRYAYSVDSGLTWLTNGLNIDSFITSTAWTVVPEIQINNPLADNNPALVFRIEFIPPGNTGTSGNTRLDNFSVTALNAPGGGTTGDNIAPVVTITPTNGAVNILRTSQPLINFNEDVRLMNGALLDSANIDNIVELRLNDSIGVAIPFNAQISANLRNITIVPDTLLGYSTTYYVALKPNMVKDTSNNVVIGKPFTIFTTEVIQTVFSAGDFLPVAYRTSATGADDEIALLSFVNILPGTKVKMTDMKYTSNVPAQCPGGFEWTAPAPGVAAGSTIYIVTNNGTANVGSITGSTFGLSSGGDQVMVYTGTNTNPNYITALSSVSWVTSNTSCSGSLSLIPATLSNYVNAFSLNAANAYYNGPQSGTIPQLKQSILDTSNWIGVGSGTTPQQWPNYTFFGPPTVLSAVVKNATTIEVVFSLNMDSTSAVSISNYTGIGGLSSITFSSNGMANDTVLLHFSSSFVSNANYSLTVSNVKDVLNRPIAAPHVFSFTYTSTFSFDKEFVVVNENQSSLSIRLNLNNPASSSIDLVLKPSPWTNADSTQDFSFQSQTLNFTGSSNNIQNIVFTISDDSFSEMDEYVVIELKNPNNLSIEGKTQMVIYIKDNDYLNPTAEKTIELIHVSSFDPNPLGSSAEVVAYDSINQHLLVTSAIQNRFDIVDFSNPNSLQTIQSVDVSAYGGITSIAVFNGLIAVASPNTNEQLNGSVLFYNSVGVFQKQVTVGALPDMITFNKSGNKVLTANEGQPNDAYTVDPEGSVSIIDLSGGITNLTQANVKTLGFNQFNALETSLIASGVRKTKSTSTLSQDFEPEYITISDDDTKAWVSLQENNSLGLIDLINDSIIEVKALGTKNMNMLGNSFDASDVTQVALMSNWPIKAFHMPDAITNFTINGNTYLVMANEGDEKDYNGLKERTTVGNNATILDSSVFPNAAFLKQDYALGRLRITNLNGDIDHDGDYDELYCLGSRSFSIWNSTTNQMIFDSGDLFERLTLSHPKSSAIFNADNGSNAYKNRSRSKGPEPEGVAITKILDRFFAFISLERVGGVMVFEVTDPANPVFVDFNNTRDLNVFAGDHGPEVITFISKANSPDGKNYLVVANEISGTLSLFEVKDNFTAIDPSSQNTKQIRVYPNPNNLGKVYFSEQVEAELYDLNGRYIKGCKYSNELGIQELPKGVYLLRINNLYNSKLIVN